MGIEKEEVIMPMYGGAYDKSKKRASSNKAGKPSFGPALSQKETKKKKGKK